MSETQAGLFGDKFVPGNGTEKGDRKIEGLRAKAERTGPGSTYLLLARTVIRTLAQTGQPFTSETVLKVIGYAPMLDHRTIGTSLREARVDGLIVATGRWTKAEARSRNGGWVREWTGVKK